MLYKFDEQSIVAEIETSVMIIDYDPLFKLFSFPFNPCQYAYL